MNTEWLKQHVTFSKGYDIMDGPFPIPSSIGEGFTFQLKDYPHDNLVDYITSAARKNGKRQLTFCIQSFMGLCGGASHYYCTAHSYINNCQVDNPNHTICGYLGGVKVPQEFKSLEFDLGIPLTEEMIAVDMGHYKYSKPGDCGTAIHNKQDFYDTIEQLKSYFNMDEWEFVIEDNAN